MTFRRYQRARHAHASCHATCHTSPRLQSFQEACSNGFACTASCRRFGDGDGAGTAATTVPEPSRSSRRLAVLIQDLNTDWPIVGRHPGLRRGVWRSRGHGFARVTRAKGRGQTPADTMGCSRHLKHAVPALPQKQDPPPRRDSRDSRRSPSATRRGPRQFARLLTSPAERRFRSAACGLQASAAGVCGDVAAPLRPSLESSPSFGPQAPRLGTLSRLPWRTPGGAHPVAVNAVRSTSCESSANLATLDGAQRRSLQAQGNTPYSGKRSVDRSEGG